MRLPHIALFVMLLTCLSCNPFAQNGHDSNANDNRNAPLDDIELQRLKSNDSMIKKLQKKRKAQASDTLKPKSA